LRRTDPEHPDNLTITRTPTQPRNVFGAKRIITDPDTSPEQSDKPSTSGTTEQFTDAPEQPTMADNQGNAPIDIDPHPQGWNAPVDDDGQPVAQVNYTTTTDEEKQVVHSKEACQRYLMARATTRKTSWTNLISTPRLTERTKA
jgi:hypothetical protein